MSDKSRIEWTDATSLESQTSTVSGRRGANQVQRFGGHAHDPRPRVGILLSGVARTACRNHESRLGAPTFGDRLYVIDSGGRPATPVGADAPRELHDEFTDARGQLSRAPTPRCATAAPPCPVGLRVVLPRVLVRVLPTQARVHRTRREPCLTVSAPRKPVSCLRLALGLRRPGGCSAAMGDTPGRQPIAPTLVASELVPGAPRAARRAPLLATFDAPAVLGVGHADTCGSGADSTFPTSHSQIIPLDKTTHQEALHG